jgi:sialic acid synthase SpsE
MVRDIRHIEAAHGWGTKEVQESERPIFKKLAKSIVSVSEIKAGTILSREMLTTKGPGNGISPTRMDDLVGKSVNHTIPADVVLQDADINW